MAQAKVMPPESVRAPQRDELGGLIGALYDVAHQARRGTTGDPVEPAGMRVLVWVQALGSPKLSELAVELQLDLSTVSRHVRALTADGFVTTERDVDDRRAQRVSLTGTGHDAIAAVVANRRAVIGAVTDHWPADDRRTLTELLRRLADDMAGRDTVAVREHDARRQDAAGRPA